MTGGERASALQIARRFVEAGANHVILSLPASAAPAGHRLVAKEVAGPLPHRG